MLMLAGSLPPGAISNFEPATRSSFSGIQDAKVGLKKPSWRGFAARTGASGAHGECTADGAAREERKERSFI
jgi:hypothetical protein